jgi:hypothetical protein
VRAIGVLTTVLVVGGVAYAGVILVRSIPDIRRYLKIRSM